MEKRDNYAVQSAIARKLFLNYDQEGLIRKLNLHADDAWLYTDFFGSDYRLNRKTGDLERAGETGWQEANSFHEVLTLLDLLCDSREMNPAALMDFPFCAEAPLPGKTPRNTWFHI